MACWEQDSAIASFGAAHNLTDGKALYGYFMRRYAAILAKYNKTAVGWCVATAAGLLAHGQPNSRADFTSIDRVASLVNVLRISEVS